MYGQPKVFNPQAFKRPSKASRDPLYRVIIRLFLLNHAFSAGNNGQCECPICKEARNVVGD